MHAPAILRPFQALVDPVCATLPIIRIGSRPPGHDVGSTGLTWVVHAVRIMHGVTRSRTPPRSTASPGRHRAMLWKIVGFM